MPRTYSLNSKRSAASVSEHRSSRTYGMNCCLAFQYLSSELRHELYQMRKYPPSYHRFHQWRQCRLSSSPENQRQSIRFRFLIDPFRQIDESVHVPGMHRKQEDHLRELESVLQCYIDHVATCFEKPFCILHSHLSVGEKKKASGDLFYLVGGGGSWDVLG
jgi:hypothetical protein